MKNILHDFIRLIYITFIFCSKN